MYRNHGIKLYFVVGTLIFAFMQSVLSQNNSEIYYKYCVARPDTECFLPINGATDTVGRNVSELGGGYRFCLKIETVDAGYAPLRVIMVLDESYSMCQNPSGGICCTDGDSTNNCMMNDPTDQRVVGAQLFVDSLAVKSPNSQVGVITYAQDADNAHDPIALNTQENIKQVKDWIYEASCVATGFDKERTTRIPDDDDDSLNSAPGGLGKTLATNATYLGMGLQAGLQLADYNIGSMPVGTARHIILLTDGAWDDVSTRAPQTLVDQYKSRNPDRTVPIIHGVFLSNVTLHEAHKYPPEGCSNNSPVILTNLQQATTLGSVPGLYFSGSTPQTVVANFATLLSRMVSKVELALSAMVVTNTTNGQVRNQTGIQKVSADSDSVHYQATINNLPLEFGLNTLTVQRIVDNPGTKTSDTATGTVYIYRTSSWISNVNQEEYDLYCEKDSTTVSIKVAPPVLLVNNPFDVDATIALKEKFILDTVEVRIFTQFPDADQNSVGVFHLERNFINSTNGTEGTGSTAGFTATDALFGSSALNQGLFSTIIPTIATDFALETWIKPSNAGEKTDIFSGSGFSFGIGADRILYFSANGTELARAVIAVDANTWSHVAVSRISGNLIIFVNGVNVTQPVQFAGALAGAITVSCPPNGVLDEVRISNTSRMRPDPRFLRFDIPTVQKPTWTLAGQPLTQPVLLISPDKWNNGNIKFQFATSVYGKLVVNFQHKGTDSETQWSKNGNPVFSAADLEGPYVTKAIFTNGPLGDIWDTLKVIFSEPVRCDSLKKSLDPSTSFKIYGPDNIVKDTVFKGAHYIDGEACPENKRIKEVTIITMASVDGIVPKKDCIRLFGSAVDTAGNYPDTTKCGPIEYGPGSGITIRAYQNAANEPSMIIPEGFSRRTGVPQNEGKAIVIQTRGVLIPGITPEGKLTYGKTVLFDAVANVVAVDLPIEQFKNNERMYYVVWDGTNRVGRRVSSGAYLLKATVQYTNEPEKYVPIQTKFSIKW